MADSKISALNSKTTPVNADSFPIYDSEASATKQVTMTNLKAFLKTYFDTVYGTQINNEAMGGSGTSRTVANTPISGTLIVIDNGVVLVENVDFTLSSKTATFTVAPDSPRAFYRY
jgi:hypothetical protein